MAKEGRRQPQQSVGLSWMGITVPTWIIAIVFLLIASSFFILLSSKTGISFGLRQIIYSFVFAFVGTWFLSWTKRVMRKNLYLGAVLGLLGIGVSVYALSYEYSGPYTTVFSVITSVVALIYIAFFFVKYRD